MFNLQRESRVSFAGPALIRGVSQWSSKFRGEDGEQVVPPAGQCYQRTSSTPTTDKPYLRQTSRKISTRSETQSISPADYHKDIKQDIQQDIASVSAAMLFNILWRSYLESGNLYGDTVITL